MKKSTLSSRYLNGVEEFLNFAFSFSSEEGTISFPSVNFNNVYFKSCEKVQLDLVSKGIVQIYTSGIVQIYTHWYYHGEEEGEEDDFFFEESGVGDDMLGTLNEGLGMSHIDSRMFDQLGTFEEPNEKTKRFFRLLKYFEKMLYPRCTKYSKLSFLVKLLHIKCLCGWSNNSITILLEFLRDAFPNAKENIPESYYK